MIAELVAVAPVLGAFVVGVAVGCGGVKRPSTRDYRRTVRRAWALERRNIELARALLNVTATAATSATETTDGSEPG